MNHAPLNRSASLLLKLAVLLVIALVLVQCRAQLPGLPMLPANAQTTDLEAIEQAIRQAIEQQKEGIPALLLYETRIDEITLSKDRKWATAWLTPIGPDTGQVVPTEPGLVFVQRIDDGWKVYLPTDPDWNLALLSAPEDLVPMEKKSAWAAVAELATPDSPERQRMLACIERSTPPMASLEIPRHIISRGRVATAPLVSPLRHLQQVGAQTIRFPTRVDWRQWLR